MTSDSYSRMLIDSLPDALVVTDRAGCITLANRRAEVLFESEPGELVGRLLADRVSEGSRLGWDELLAKLPRLPVDLNCRSRNGPPFPVEVTVASLKDGFGLVFAIRDVTDREQVEERNRLNERRREQHMLRAEQMMAIGQVAAGVAHELRNPLTSIKGLVQVNLREAVARGMPAKDLAIIEHEIRRMERTLQTFLDFARPPQPDRRRLDLTAIVDRVYALAGGRARKQAVTLKFDRPVDPVWVDGDQDQLQQLLLNLVLNALDAMPRGGMVEVILTLAPGGMVELRVRDTGPGIAPHILPKVFETFVSSKETGVGLGLPLSRRIAEDHGGSLTAYNLPQGGAGFSLRLPVKT